MFFTIAFSWFWILCSPLPRLAATHDTRAISTTCWEKWWHHSFHKGIRVQLNTTKHNKVVGNLNLKPLQFYFLAVYLSFSPDFLCIFLRFPNCYIFPFTFIYRLAPLFYFYQFLPACWVRKYNLFQLKTAGDCVDATVCKKLLRGCFFKSLHSYNIIQ